MTTPITSEKSTPHLGSELVRYLRPYADIQLIHQRRKLYMQDKNIPLCYLILEGSVTLNRIADDISLQIVQAPTLLGVVNITGESVDCYIETITPCKIGILSAQTAHDVIEKNGLWELFSKYLILAARRVLASGKSLSAPTAYEIICQQLICLMDEDIGIRRDISVEKYISKKTLLSRSRIMKILSDLRGGGFIEMEKGRLLKIKKLPQKY